MAGAFDMWDKDKQAERKEGNGTGSKRRCNQRTRNRKHKIKQEIMKTYETKNTGP